MTCREKLKIEHPGSITHFSFGGCRGCPHNYGYLPRSKRLCVGDYSEYDNERCTKCWDQEVEDPIIATAAKTVETETYDYHAYAKHLRMKYEALIEAGFNEDQATQLIPMWMDK